jgi:hypothetical protein
VIKLLATFLVTFLFLVAVGMLLSHPAHAANAQLGITPGTGVNLICTQDGSGNYLCHNVICDATAGANCVKVNAAGALLVDGSGTALPVSGNVGITGTPAVAANTTLLATGGCSSTTIHTAASNNGTVIGTAAAHTLCGFRWENTTTTLMDIRFYDTATAPVGGAPCNSATGIVSNDVAQSNAISPGGVANLGPAGMAFASGIVVCITGANADNDNTNAATGINLTVLWK